MLASDAIVDQLNDILHWLQVLVEMAYEAGDGDLAVWAEKACDDADQFLLSSLKHEPDDLANHH